MQAGAFIMQMGVFVMQMEVFVPCALLQPNFIFTLLQHKHILLKDKRPV